MIIITDEHAIIVVVPSLYTNFISSRRVKQLLDVRNIVLYIFAIIVLAITWSGVKAVQRNYELQKQISVLNQENQILELENSNSKLRNKYLETDQYKELSARQNLGLAAPGEKVLTVPKSVALKYVEMPLVEAEADKVTATGPTGYKKNLQNWRDFLLGRKLFDD